MPSNLFHSSCWFWLLATLLTFSSAILFVGYDGKYSSRRNRGQFDIASETNTRNNYRLVTPDQIRAYVEVAVKQRGGYELLYIALAAIVFFAVGFLSSYLTAKGQSLATKEDIGTITKNIKGVEHGFNTSLEQLKTDLASRGYYNQLRYQREMEIFREIWPKLANLNEAAQLLRPAFDSLPPEGESPEVRDKRRVDVFYEHYKQLEAAVYHNEPFIPPKIWEEIKALLNLFWYEASDSRIRGFGRPPSDYWNSAMKNKDAMAEQLKKVREAVRKRLTEFD